MRVHRNVVQHHRQRARVGNRAEMREQRGFGHSLEVVVRRHHQHCIGADLLRIASSRNRLTGALASHACKQPFVAGDYPARPFQQGASVGVVEQRRLTTRPRYENTVHPIARDAPKGWR